MRRTISLLALAGLAWAAALAAAAAPASLSVRLVAPRGGETLAAGSLAEIAWEPLASFGRSHPLPEIEEWEAFLSLDGGGHYTVRVTPHLDRDLRRAVWRVPAIPTRDARLLLRFGDEREETVVELPQRFAIAVQPAESSSHDLAPERLALTSGEPARPGEAGIVSWVEGDRRGEAARQVVAAAPPAAHAAPTIAESRAPEPALTSAAPALDPAAAAGSHPLPPERRALRPVDRAAAAPILLQTQRRNE